MKINITLKNFIAKHKIKVSEFYKKNYSLISHGNDMKKKFNKINNLKSKSDNYHRVKRILSSDIVLNL